MFLVKNVWPSKQASALYINGIATAKPINGGGHGRNQQRKTEKSITLSAPGCTSARRSHYE